MGLLDIFHKERHWQQDTFSAFNMTLFDFACDHRSAEKRDLFLAEVNNIARICAINEYSGLVVIKTIGEAALLSVDAATTALRAIQEAPFHFKPEFSANLSRMLALFSLPEVLANNQYPLATKVVQDIACCKSAPGIAAALSVTASLPAHKI